MTPNCPSCRRSVAPEAAFCMFCGQKLGDPDRTTDQPTEGYAPLPDGQTDDRPPDRVGGYKLLRKLGQGGMGVVYEAESDDSGERVAVKLLSAKLAGSPNSVERFRQEGRLASQISHPRCVFVYGADTDAGRPFIVMELMPGTTLKDAIDKHGPMSFPEAIRRILDVIDGLTEAHRLGVIHRDVKPSNCFLTADNRVKVGDFGLSKSLDTDSDGSLTRTGAFLGTVLFAAPEQIRGEEVGYDSDVYSVSATLYYLLTGRAPFQHESVTAALARAISEPPKPVRSYRPDVPRAVEKVVLKGLERDRNRRYASLDDLRDALIGLLPDRQQPARPRALVAAYVLDVIVLLLLVQIPVELLELLVGSQTGLFVKLGPAASFDPLQALLLTLYFAVGEGVFGVTVGKLLVRVRVTRADGVGPPGFWRAMVRAVVFNLLWGGVFVGFVLAVFVRWIGLLPGLALFAGFVYPLVYQLRAKAGGRGWHDRAAGTRCVQKPRPAQRVRLLGKGPNPLDAVRPDRRQLPAAVGGFLVKGSLVDVPDGSRVWAAEDRSLNRRVLIWVRPANRVPDDDPPPPVRPTRLRSISSGDLLWEAGAFHWQAFVIPTGAPLADTVSPAEPLAWADARVVLEQVVDEMRAAEADGTLPADLHIDQLWAEPDGRVHLMPFPIPSARGATARTDGPMGLVRQVASLTLEGTPRMTGGPVAAPLPAHAQELARRLFEDRRLRPDDVQILLADTHTHAPRVTTAMRLAHVGLTAALTSAPLLFLLALVFGMPLNAALFATVEAMRADEVRGGLERDDVVALWRGQPVVQGDPAMAAGLAPDALPATRARVERLRDQLRDNKARQVLALSRPEAFLHGQTFDDEKTPLTTENPRYGASQYVQVLYELRLPDGRVLAMSAGFVLWLVLIAFVVFAVAFRGGLSFFLSGIALVRRDGRPAGRLNCGLRELLLWLPFAAALLAVIVLFAVRPGWVTTRLTFTAFAVLGLFGMAVAGVRTPTRGPHDRLTGTFPVPR